MPSRKPKRKVVHGDNLIYQFLKKVLIQDEEKPLIADLPQLIIETMAIWWPLDVYRELPILLPWVVRDNKCRASKSRGTKEEWGAPDEDGYLRDDNSLIKALPRNLCVRGPKEKHLENAVMGTEFVACHIWREVQHEKLANRLPLLNSFIPNLVWLPSQIAKLTDLEGESVQRILQAMSFRIYRNAPVKPGMEPIVRDAWGLIPPPRREIQEINLSELNWFEATPRFLDTRLSRLKTVVSALEALECGEPITKKVTTTRYSEGLPRVAPESRRALLEYLKRFAVSA